MSPLSLPTTTRWKPVCWTLFLFFAVLSTSLWAAEADEDAGESKETLFSLILKGGYVMIPLGAASIITFAIALERFLSLKKDKVLPNGFLQGLAESWHADPSGQMAEQYCDNSPGAAGHVFKAGIQWRDAGYQAVAKAIEDAGIREADKMKRSLRGLSIVAAVSPLLGLLGTVYGMIQAFQVTATSKQAAKINDLASGIYEALVTTATGLTIAIPAMLLYQVLSARVDALVDYIDEVGTEFIAKHALITNPEPAAGYDPNAYEEQYTPPSPPTPPAPPTPAEA